MLGKDLEQSRSYYLQIIATAKEWGIEQGLIHLNQMFSRSKGSEKVWFVIHSHDDLGADYFLHYYGSDEQAAHVDQSRLESIGLQTYIFSTDGVSDPEAEILESHFNLSLIALIYTILHEGLHRLLEELFFQLRKTGLDILVV